MDYAFAPGSTLQGGLSRRLFRRRIQTTLINRAQNRSTVRQFTNHVSTHGSIVRPIGDLLIGAHATDDGSFLFIPMFPGQRGPTDFETLKKTISNSVHAIAIPDATIGHTSGDPITHSFHIKGCNIGKARPFLVKLKEALGDHVNVTAPKHFHYIFWISNYGVWEAMEYEFQIVRPSPFPTRAAAVSTFQNEPNFTRIDGSGIPDADWESWVPSSITSTSNVVENINLGVSIGSRTTIPVERGFSYRPPSPKSNYVYSIAYPNSPSVPSGNAARLAALQTELIADPIFDSTHEFPDNKRWGYDSIAEFINGYDWLFRKHGRKLRCIGRRHSYTLIVPIVDPASGNLIFNFHPNTGSSHAAITSGLSETDARFFERV